METDKGEIKFTKPTPVEKTSEQISDECRADLKEIAFWFGGFAELRKVIDELEENYEQGRAEAAMEPDYDAPSVQERMEMDYKQKYS